MSAHSAKQGPWVVLVGRVDATTASTTILRSRRAVLYALVEREQVAFFEKPRGLEEANLFLDEHPLGGCRNVEEVLNEQPGLLCYFTGDFSYDAGWLQGRCVVSSVEVPKGNNWDMTTLTCRSTTGASCDTFTTTARLLAAYPRLSSESIAQLEGVRYVGDDGGEYSHNPYDYARDLLYDLWELLESEVAYLDVE